MIINYNYDKNGIFAGETQARLDPKATQAYGEDIYLLPRNATHTAPPTTPLEENERWRWTGIEWIVDVIPEPEPEPEEGVDVLEGVE